MPVFSKARPYRSRSKTPENRDESSDCRPFRGLITERCRKRIDVEHSSMMKSSSLGEEPNSAADRRTEQIAKTAVIDRASFQCT